jgi:hypothetical protein
VKETKAFFFKKKKQETFVHTHVHHRAHLAEHAPLRDKSSLVLFFKKEHLAFPCPFLDQS